MVKKEYKKYYIWGIIIFVMLAGITIQRLITFSEEQIKKANKIVATQQKFSYGNASANVSVEEHVEIVGTCPGAGGSEVGNMGLAVPGFSPGGDLSDASTEDMIWSTAGGLPGTFCTQNGTQFWFGKDGNWPEPKENIEDRLNNDENPYTIGRKESLEFTKEYQEFISSPWLFCKSHEVNLSADPKLKGAAYAFASGEDSDTVQQAVWSKGYGESVSGVDTSGNSIKIPLNDGKPLTNISDSASALTNDMNAYQNFTESLSQDYKLDDVDVGVNITADTSEVLVQVNYTDQYMIVGPIYINYPSGGMFGGLSDLYFEGFNSAGDAVGIGEDGNTRIDVVSYGSSADDVNQSFDGFNIGKDNFTDKDYNIPQSGTADSGNGFYVKIPNPNKGLTSFSASSTIQIKASTVVELKMHYSYKWMEIVVYGCELSSKSYNVKWGNIKFKDYGYCTGDNNTEETIWDKDKKEWVGTGKYYHTHTEECKRYELPWSWDELDGQSHIVITKIIRKIITQEITEVIPIPIDININVNVNVSGAADNTMMLGGKVWEDAPKGKDGKDEGTVGFLDTKKNDDSDISSKDKLLPNVKVTLYEVEYGKENQRNGKIAKLFLNETGTTKENLMHTVNPTYTDENGEYCFTGVDPFKKYYVEFEYNGQVYMPTEYTRDLKTYNGVEWEVSSKGTETPGERTAYNERFKEIGSSPASYETTNSLGYIKQAGLDGKYYNEAFSQYDLLGFRLDENGRYHVDEENRLIDSFFTVNQDGNIVETEEFKEGVISKAIKAYMEQNLKTPDDEAMKTIYAGIANGNQEIMRKLQFIEDTKIHSYTQVQSATSYDLYPIYDKFTLNNKDKPLPAGFYPPIYEGQLFINQGLTKRNKVDLSLRKDILYAATRINGKTEVYEYNKREELKADQKAELKKLRDIYEADRTNKDAYKAYLELKARFEQQNLEDGTNKPYWEIQLRMQDYKTYYGENYTRELYPADYNYRISNNNASKGNELELYITYKITMRNLSEGIIGEITEVVDYYDKDYDYCDNLSWVMFEDGKEKDGKRHLEEVNFMETDYHDTIQNQKLSGAIGTYNDGKMEQKDDDYEKSPYIVERSKECESNMTGENGDYKALYIRGLQGKMLASGDEAYIYLTFKVKSDKDGPVILDNDDSLKQNYAEINGYKTYYADNTKLPNGVTKGSSDAAGLIDINSIPGNLCEEDIKPVKNETDERYEKNFENDTDRAKSIKVVLNDEFIRSINGTVWEDARTQAISNAMIGDGVMTNKDSIKVAGVTVELVERKADGSLYLWETKTVYTNSEGKYEIENIIPGNYFVRFKYGDTVKTANTDQNGGLNKTSYNGQDFKSTVYQKDLKDSSKQLGSYAGTKIKDSNGEDINKVYYDDGTEEAFEVGYYDIKELDKLRGEDGKGTNFSDAKDIWSIREKVNSYSSNNGNGVTNKLAEILASPYTTGDTTDLMNNTKMTAVTGLIVLEGEYARSNSDGNNAVSNGDYKNENDKNGKYTLNGVDFGLTERPKAQLELDKKVTNVKITLANGNTIFDANAQATDLTWREGKPYELEKGITGNKYNEYYTDKNKHRYSYREEEVDKLVKGTYENKENGNKGTIIATMDEEYMQGANIAITYQLTVKNVGEVDYEGQDFYYKGTGTNKIATTSANVVADYVVNNLTFNADAKSNDESQKSNSDNGWTITNASGLETSTEVQDASANYNSIIKTENLKKNLLPSISVAKNSTDDTATVSLVLTQLINPENNSDTQLYDNIAEITNISNTVGRRMAYSIQGNQKPNETPKEVDSSKAERVTILPPFGIGNTVVYIAIAVGALVILAGGIILIKKKVLKK